VKSLSGKNNTSDLLNVKNLKILARVQLNLKRKAEAKEINFTHKNNIYLPKIILNINKFT
jgi:hypothetical protein